LAETLWQQLIGRSSLAAAYLHMLIGKASGKQFYWWLFAAACSQKQLTSSSLLAADNWQLPIGSR
jgi:hypothetical protein